MKQQEKDYEPFMRHLRIALEDQEPHDGFLSSSLTSHKERFLSMPPIDWEKHKPEQLRKKGYYRVGKSDPTADGAIEERQDY